MRKKSIEQDSKDMAEFELTKEKNIALLKEMEEVKAMLEYANMEFNSQINSDLIESCIYNIESLEKKYNYLIKEARKQNIRCNAKVVYITG